VALEELGELSNSTGTKGKRKVSYFA
jgi:hypothetical protein